MASFNPNILQSLELPEYGKDQGISYPRTNKTTPEISSMAVITLGNTSSGILPRIIFPRKADAPATRPKPTPMAKTLMVIRSLEPNTTNFGNCIKLIPSADVPI